jgi:hypothetical protein
MLPFRSNKHLQQIEDNEDYDERLQDLQMNEIPQTLSQEHLEFLDGIDEVPDRIKEKFWGLFTRMNALTFIPNEFEMHRARVYIRATIRPMMWKGELTHDEVMQIKRYIEMMIQKSRNQSERRLLAPWLQEMIQIQKTDNYKNERPGLLRGGGLRFLMGGR